MPLSDFVCIYYNVYLYICMCPLYRLAPEVELMNNFVLETGVYYDSLQNFQLELADIVYRAMFLVYYV